jgi:hypothetical protein
MEDGAESEFGLPAPRDADIASHNKFINSSRRNHLRRDTTHRFPFGRRVARIVTARGGQQVKCYSSGPVRLSPERVSVARRERERPRPKPGPLAGPITFPAMYGGSENGYGSQGEQIETASAEPLVPTFSVPTIPR